MIRFSNSGGVFQFIAGSFSERQEIYSERHDGPFYQFNTRSSNMTRLLLFFTLILLPLIQGYSLPPYENCRIINNGLKFKFYWNTSTDGFYGAVESSTFGGGYAALGVASSTTRSMTSNGAGSDAWIFYFSGSTPKSADGWMTQHDNPLTDSKNDIQVLGGGTVSSGLKAVEFYRKYNTGDSRDSVVDPSQLVNFIYAAHPNSPVIVGSQEIEMEEHGTARCGLVGIILSAHSSCDPVTSGGGPSFTAPDGTFRANWTLTSTDITFMMSGLGTGGYVAMGWNMNGGMPNADMVVGWLDQSNNAIVSDRWSSNRNMPVLDTSNGGHSDVTNVQGYVETYNNAQWTTFIFTRPSNSGDSSDIAIVNGPMHLLYAVGQSGSVNYGANTFQQHSSKGDVVVNFFDLNGTVVVTPPPPPSPSTAAGNSTTGGNSYTSPDGTFKASWVVSDPNITFTISGTTSTGWVGIGWNTKGGMPNTDMVVGWIDGSGNVVALDTWASKRDMPSEDTSLGGDSYLYNVTGLIEKVDGKKWMTITFTRPLKVTDKYDITIADQQYHMLWGVGSDGSVNYASKSYSQHSTQGDVLVNFFSSNALCDAAASATNPYFKAHGILMIVGWTMMLYVGTYIARYMKPVTSLWFKVHVALQTIGCFAVVAAFVLILVYYNGGFTVGWHQMIGLFVIIGTVAQPIIGAIADRMYDPSRTKIPVWPDQIHWWLGRITSIVALAAIFLGIWVYMPTSLVAYILFGAYCLLTFIIILVSELKIGVAHENEVYTDDMQIDEGKVKKNKVHLTRNLFWSWLAIGFLIIIALVIFVAINGYDNPSGC